MKTKWNTNTTSIVALAVAALAAGIGSLPTARAAGTNYVEWTQFLFTTYVQSADGEASPTTFTINRPHNQSVVDGETIIHIQAHIVHAGYDNLEPAQWSPQIIFNGSAANWANELDPDYACRWDVYFVGDYNGSFMPRVHDLERDCKVDEYLANGNHTIQVVNQRGEGNTPQPYLLESFWTFQLINRETVEVGSYDASMQFIGGDGASANPRDEDLPMGTGAGILMVLLGASFAGWVSLRGLRRLRTARQKREPADVN